MKYLTPLYYQFSLMEIDEPEEEEVDEPLPLGLSD